MMVAKPSRISPSSISPSRPSLSNNPPFLLRNQNPKSPPSILHISKKKKPSSSSFIVESTLSSPTTSAAAAVTPAQTRVDILSESLPFIQKFRGKTIVVKYGGAAMKSESLQASVIKNIVLLSCVGIRPVFVHGDGPEINTWLAKLNLQSNFLIKVNKHLAFLINNAGATAVSLSGNDGRLLTARPSPKSAQLSFVRDIANVDPTILRLLIANDHIPVIASVAADHTGQAYNINADTVAGELAAALGAEKLILLTDVAGILENRDDPLSLVKEIDIKGVKRMVEEGKVAGGMIPKVNCCVRSLAQGVRTASIIDGRVPNSLLDEILTDEGAGTMITV